MSKIIHIKWTTPSFIQVKVNMASTQTKVYGSFPKFSCVIDCSASNSPPLFFSTAVTAYASQVAFPSLGQSTVYSGFPQSGQTYGLPPFGLCFTQLLSVL